MGQPLSIERLETFVVALPPRRPHLWVGLDSPAGNGYVVTKVLLSDGSVGWGEAQAIRTWGGDNARRYGETPATTVTLIHNCLKPALTGVDVRQVEVVHQKMNRALRGYPYAKAALEVAMLDALGHSFKVPVYQLLGGKVRDRIPLAHSIGLMDAEAAAREAADVVAEGIRTLKVKIGVDIERDVKVVRAVRQAIGPDARIRVDANQGYRNWRDGAEALRRMEEFDILYAEQLVDGLAGMAEIAARSNVPIMADESAWTDRDVVEIAQRRAAEYLSVYYTKPGGLVPAKRLLAVAGAFQMQCDINGSGEMGVGNAANVHLAASSPEITLAGTIPVTSTAEVQRTKVAGRKYLDDIVRQPFAYDDGHLVVPDGPGLGIEVDEAKLQKYSVAV
ncbi:enolase C-terminal domain-like protein [Ramlibacter tataouinensis]|uniref:mandelate racemase/muconate lactonizing enzyme family protein n=1 Tax=Ramlibacter tataouinensis TaxID=94132 RepID=UPI0022F3D356|nr:enolase C-terminal domain-like protein [Ramlibacter tataouinensis]WBY00552.1 enolase C-terminal domain-like protein [Ramlibacter tataouinensis]